MDGPENTKALKKGSGYKDQNQITDNSNSKWPALSVIGCAALVHYFIKELV